MIEDYEAQGEDAPEFLPYGLTFQHKHVPELQDLCQAFRAIRSCSRRSAISRKA